MGHVVAFHEMGPQRLEHALLHEAQPHLSSWGGGLRDVLREGGVGKEFRDRGFEFRFVVRGWGGGGGMRGDGERLIGTSSLDFDFLTVR